MKDDPPAACRGQGQAASRRLSRWPPAAGLLRRSDSLEHEVRPKGLWPKGKPLDWNLGNLIPTATKAGRFPESFAETPSKYVDLQVAQLGDAARWVKWLRNLVHPGAYVRDMPPNLQFGETVFGNAYAVLDGAFRATAEVLDRAMERGDWTQK